MSPFVIFVIIFIGIVLWALSTMASMVNRQQEAERRRRFREMMEQSQSAGGGQFAQASPIRPPPVPQQRLNPGYAVRHPEMVRPVPPPPPRRLAQQPQQRRKPAPARRVAMPPPPIPVLEADDEPAPQRRPALREVVAKPQATTTATAPAIKRWLQPSTLRQQFILTELFQPPLALRDDHARP